MVYHNIHAMVSLHAKNDWFRTDLLYKSKLYIYAKDLM